MRTKFARSLQAFAVAAPTGVAGRGVGMWFGVLGPLLVGDGDSVNDVQSGRQRVLLAALLVRTGTVVPADTLAEVMWDGAPPTGAETTLRSHVMRLRRALGPAAAARVVTRYPGYQIQAGEAEVDLLRFRCLCRDGGAAARAGEWARAWEMLGEALGLWRGEPLADVPSDLLRREHLPGLEQLRLQAVEWRMDAGLQLGFHAELVPELEPLAARHPLQEHFHAQLMLALVRCGRQAEALEAYRRARDALVEELGAEPGAELRELHQRVLAADPALAVPHSTALTGHRPAAVVPRQLPAPAAGFAGRAAELAALTNLLDRSGDQTPPAVVISAIGGTAGVGKTALAVRWAHQVAHRFPDGQLYVNLRGYDPDQPMPATDVLAGFLRALGVPGQDIPAEDDERAARYRSLLAGGRTLVVLDNARSEEQVRPLLPGSPGCAVVVTSRDSLAGLVARDGAQRLELDLLPLEDAIGLLRALIGRRADNDLGAAGALADQCCRLPLALRVAAELAITRPAVSLAELVGELADQQRRLDLLQAGGDPRTAVRAVFSWSYRHLAPEAARAFRLLGLHPGVDFEAYTAAALTGASLRKARQALDALVRAHLIHLAGPDRYGMHDLLRHYARELSAHDGEHEQRVALTRLFDHYLRTAAAAMDILVPAERYQRPRVSSPVTPTPPVDDPAAAQSWLDYERANLVVTTVHTADNGWPGHATRLSATLFRYLEGGGYNSEAATIHSHARRAAHRVGDHDAEATALSHLGAVDARQGRCGQAMDHLTQALVLYRATINRPGEARTLLGLGAVDLMQSRHEQATGHLQQALALCRQIGDRLLEATTLSNLSLARLRLGHYERAADHARRALALYRETGYRTGEAYALSRLGDVCRRQGDYQQAADHQQRALALFRETGDQSGEAEALNGLGEVFLALGQPVNARAVHSAALSLAGHIGDTYQEAHAHNGLARALRATGNDDQVRHLLQQALVLFTELGAPEADQVRAQLAGSEDDSRPEPEPSR